MKNLILTAILGLSLNVQAKLNDFNALIEENNKAQTQLHMDLAQKLDATRVAVQAETRDRVLVDNSKSINVPTSKSFLTYAKEKTFHRASDIQAQKRLAQEVESAE